MGRGTPFSVLTPIALDPALLPEHVGPRTPVEDTRHPLIAVLDALHRLGRAVGVFLFGVGALVVLVRALFEMSGLSADVILRLIHCAMATLVFGRVLLAIGYTSLKWWATRRLGTMSRAAEQRLVVLAAAYYVIASLITVRVLLAATLVMPF